MFAQQRVQFARLNAKVAVWRRAAGISKAFLERNGFATLGKFRDQKLLRVPDKNITLTSFRSAAMSARQLLQHPTETAIEIAPEGFCRRKRETLRSEPKPDSKPMGAEYCCWSGGA